MTTPPTHHYVIGLDLGKLADYSALALLRWPTKAAMAAAKPLPHFRSELQAHIERERHYDVTMLKRWPLQTSYNDIVDGLIRLYQMKELSASPPLLVVDSTGVGEAVVDMCRERIGRAGIQGGMVAITITAGSAFSFVGNGRWRVAKRALVSTMTVVLGNRRLHVAKHLPEAANLVRELQTFSVKIDPETKNESFESWREKDHDDLVLAVALALWTAERMEPEPPAESPPGLRVLKV
jgi:hypothetical protein